MKKKIGWYFAGVLALAMVARAGIITYNAVLVNETALAYNNTYPVNLQSNGIGTLSAQAYYSSATVANATFKDGSQATGSFTVLSFAALKSASAVDHLTVTNTGLAGSGATIIVPGFTFREGVDWAVGNVASNTAVNIKNALATVPYLSVSASGSIVYATATAGSYYNSFGLVSTNANIVAATPQFVGGQDNAVIKINGTPLLQGSNWTAATANSNTATSIASAINASSALNTHIHAAASGAVVTTTSTLNGALFNYSIVSSTPTALLASGALMTGGNTSAFTLGSSLFTVPAHGLTLALPVLYSGTPAIGGLIAQTTYYALPLSVNAFELAKYSTSAVAGTDLVLITSTNTQLSQHTYTLAPLGIAGSPSFKWQVSNDNSVWTDLAVSSVTVGLTDPANSTIWSFGFIGTQLLRLNVIAPTAGGLALRVVLIGTN